jgi:type VI secretion system protein VasD
MSSDFLTLSDNPKATLATSYISHKEKQVKPGESTILPGWKLDEETTLIGVAVGYSSIEKINWRAVERVNATGESYNILIPIRTKSVAVQIHR